jgi:diguanylate cyclase (GGDEF)-like protein
MPAETTEELAILFIEDQPDDVELETRALQRDGLVFRAAGVSSEAAMRRALEEFRPGIILCDYSIPGFSGRRALAIAKESVPETPFIFVSGTIGEETAVECLREGAVDYVLKGSLRRLGPAVRRALREVQERRDYEARIRHLANHDAATDLPNRSLLSDRIEQAVTLARRANRGLTLLVLRLEGLRRVHEGFGHDAGDEAVRQVAASLASSIRRGDTIARIGGDEFAVLLADLDRAEDVHPYGRRLMDAAKRPLEVGGTRVQVTASAGAAIFPGDGESAEALIRNASAAAHQAAAAGRDTFQFCSPDTMRKATERVMLESALGRALERGELDVHFQPQYRLADDGICGMEALVRWRRGDGTFEGPASFIGVAEDSGLIGPIGEHVLERACAVSAPWIRDSASPIVLGVNVSAFQLGERFVESVAGVLQKTGLPPQCLELEITETVLMSGERGDLEALARLRSLGVRIAIDDFGTGYSSLGYLSRFPVDRLKIDGSFVRRMLEFPRDAAIVRAIVALGHSLGLEVIAEGVETTGQNEALRAFACDAVQGFLHSEPVPPERMVEILRAMRN